MRVWAQAKYGGATAGVAGQFFVARLIECIYGFGIGPKEARMSALAIYLVLVCALVVPFAISVWRSA